MAPTAVIKNSAENSHVALVSPNTARETPSGSLRSHVAPGSALPALQGAENLENLAARALEAS